MVEHFPLEVDEWGECASESLEKRKCRWGIDFENRLIEGSKRISSAQKVSANSREQDLLGFESRRRLRGASFGCVPTVGWATSAQYPLTIPLSTTRTRSSSTPRALASLWAVYIGAREFAKDKSFQNRIVTRFYSQSQALSTCLHQEEPQ